MGLGFVLALAEGAARGIFARWMSARASALLGIRAAKVGCPAVTSLAIREPGGLGRRMLKGPGQNAEIKGMYIGGIESVPARA